MRFALFVFAVLGYTACLAPAASAWDDVPPPPAPPSLADLPPSGAFPDEDVPEPDGSDNEPVSEALDEEAPPTAIEETVPEPYYVPASISAAPAAATQPRLTRATDYPSGKDCRPGCAQRRDDCCWPIDCRGCRYGRFEVTLEGTSGMLVEAATGPFALEDYGSADKITYDGLDYGSFFDEFGGRLTLAYAINPQEWVEVRGTYYGKWSSTASDTGTFAFAPGPGGVGGAIAPNATTFDSSAEAYGGELNWMTELSCEGSTRWNALLGVRYFRFDEDLSAGNWAAPFGGFGPGTFAGSSVENAFLGLQLGGSMQRDLCNSVTFSAGLKGLLGNMNRKAAVTDTSFFAGGTHAASNEDDEIVWGADVELALKWRLTSRIALTGGYNFFMVDGVQRADKAMDFTKSTSGAIQVQTATDQVTIHSLFFGVNFNF